VRQMVSGQAEIECPFCGKMGVKAFHKPSHLEPKVSHISAGSKTKYYRVPESYDVLSGCPNCGKPKQEIERVFKTGVIRQLSHEERLKRLRDAGLPTLIKHDSRHEG
jgi:predicted RNA-binding Zn-ribbon protein involved in translation (DUF1610 family)